MKTKNRKINNKGIKLRTIKNTRLIFRIMCVKKEY